jgi:hypothetical protein
MVVNATAVIGKIEVLQDGQVQVRTDTVIHVDGVEVSRLYHRGVLVPGTDVRTQDPRVVQVCQAVWTPDVLTAFTAQKITIKAAGA